MAKETAAPYWTRKNVEISKREILSGEQALPEAAEQLLPDVLAASISPTDSKSLARTMAKDTVALYLTRRNVKT
jgi:hypothetical protein